MFLFPDELWRNENTIYSYYLFVFVGFFIFPLHQVVHKVLIVPKRTDTTCLEPFLPLGYLAVNVSIERLK